MIPTHKATKTIMTDTTMKKIATAFKCLDVGSDVAGIGEYPYLYLVSFYKISYCHL